MSTLEKVNDDRLVNLIRKFRSEHSLEFTSEELAAAVRREFCVGLEHDYDDYAKEDNSRNECNDCGQRREAE